MFSLIFMKTNQKITISIHAPSITYITMEWRKLNLKFLFINFEVFEFEKT